MLARIDLVRLSDRVLRSAGRLELPELRSLDAIHLASAQLFGAELRQVVTYDEGMGEAARELGLKTASPR